MKASPILQDTSFVPFDGAALGQSISDRFLQQVAKHPNRVAVKTATQELSYAALNKASNQIAHTIRTHSSRQGEPVAVMMEKGADVIAVLLGVLKVGKIYTPIDPVFPRARIDYMLQDSKAGLIICNHNSLALAREYASDQIALLNVDEIDSRLSSDNLDVSLNIDSPIWILYTSGSTGQPKGVIQTHRNLLHYVMVYTNAMQICPGDKFSLLYSCAVNGGAHEIFSALLNGAALYPYNIQIDGIAGIGEWLAGNGLTIYSSVPTVFRHFADTLSGHEDFRGLRYIKLIGEPVYKRDVDLFKQYFPDSCKFINRLGSSETGTIRWFFIDRSTSIDSNNVPVGYAVDENDVLLLDKFGAEVEPSQVGEIAIRSRYLSPGYWRKPDVTGKAFLPDPDGGDRRIYLSGDMGQMASDGCLTCLGRKDSQIKIRGYRVEAGEVEKALLETGFVKDVFVRALSRNGEDPQLVAYVVYDSKVDTNVSNLRRVLADTLPTYMIPSTFVILDVLPLAPNGKVDRGVLPMPNGVRPQLDSQFVAPSTCVEHELAKIWCEVLEFEEIGIHDDFLQLGGDSIKALRITSRVNEFWGTNVPQAQLLLAGTIERMATVINQVLANSASDEKLSD